MTTTVNRAGGVIAELRRLRCHRRISQEMLSERVGVCKNRVGMWEGGHDTPGYMNLQAWANALGHRIVLAAQGVDG